MFGYKLAGPAALSAKNIYLAPANLLQPRVHGVFQVFQYPHPPRLCPNCFAGHQPARMRPAVDQPMLDAGMALSTAWQGVDALEAVALCVGSPSCEKHFDGNGTTSVPVGLKVDSGQNLSTGQDPLNRSYRPWHLGDDDVDMSPRHLSKDKARIRVPLQKGHSHAVASSSVPVNAGYPAVAAAEDAPHMDHHGAMPVADTNADKSNTAEMVLRDVHSVAIAAMQLYLGRPFVGLYSASDFDRLLAACPAAVRLFVRRSLDGDSSAAELSHGSFFPPSMQLAYDFLTRMLFRCTQYQHKQASCSTASTADDWRTVRNGSVFNAQPVTQQAGAATAATATAANGCTASTQQQPSGITPSQADPSNHHNEHSSDHSLLSGGDVSQPPVPGVMPAGHVSPSGGVVQQVVYAAADAIASLSEMATSGELLGLGAQPQAMELCLPAILHELYAAIMSSRLSDNTAWQPEPTQDHAATAGTEKGCNGPTSTETPHAENGSIKLMGDDVSSSSIDYAASHVNGIHVRSQHSASGMDGVVDVDAAAVRDECNMANSSIQLPQPDVLQLTQQQPKLQQLHSILACITMAMQPDQIKHHLLPFVRSVLMHEVLTATSAAAAWHVGLMTSSTSATHGASAGEDDEAVLMRQKATVLHPSLHRTLCKYLLVEGYVEEVLPEVLSVVLHSTSKGTPSPAVDSVLGGVVTTNTAALSTAAGDPATAAVAASQGQPMNVSVLSHDLSIQPSCAQVLAAQALAAVARQLPFPVVFEHMLTPLWVALPQAPIAGVAQCAIGQALPPQLAATHVFLPALSAAGTAAVGACEEAASVHSGALFGALCILDGLMSHVPSNWLQRAVIDPSIKQSTAVAAPAPAPAATAVDNTTQSSTAQSLVPQAETVISAGKSASSSAVAPDGLLPLVNMLLDPDRDRVDLGLLYKILAVLLAACRCAKHGKKALLSWLLPLLLAPLTVNLPMPSQADAATHPSSISWQLVYMLYPGAIQQAGLQAVHAAVPNWPVIEPTLQALFGWDSSKSVLSPSTFILPNEDPLYDSSGYAVVSDFDALLCDANAAEDPLGPEVLRGRVSDLLLHIAAEQDSIRTYTTTSNFLEGVGWSTPRAAVVNGNFFVSAAARWVRVLKNAKLDHSFCMSGFCYLLHRMKYRNVLSSAVDKGHFLQGLSWQAVCQVGCMCRACL